MKTNKVAIRISSLLATAVTTVVLLCFQLGVIPDWQSERLEHQAKLSESLAITLSLGAIQGGEEAAHQQLQLFKRRFEQAESLGLRRSQAELLTAVGSHDATWEAWKQKYPRSCFEVPIVENGKLWGNLEVAFKPSAWDILPAVFSGWMLVPAILGIMTFIVSHLLLGRVLQHLDPSRVVPGRVRDTLDTFAEGILLLDDKERIVLANRSFAESVRLPAHELIGRQASELNWSSGEEDEPQRLPWKEENSKQNPVHGMPVNYESEEGSQFYTMNSVPVLDDKGQYRGMMVAFADITSHEEKKRKLATALDELRTSRDHIAEKNKELEFLATRDPLTSCLNRRSLFEKFDEEWLRAIRNKTPLSCIMVDIDFFKSINDTYGHKTGDDVLRDTGKTLVDFATENDLPARYGGEEFCFVMPGTDIEGALDRAEQIRLHLASLQFEEGFTITASLGVSSTESNPPDPQGLIDQADKCLYVAKRNGRNQSVRFDQIDANIEVDESKISRTKPEEQTTDVVEPEIPYRNVTALLATLAFRDPETAAHSTRVADLAVAVGRRCMGPRDSYRLEVAALLHDIGKVGVPDSILLKPGPLTDEEWRVMSMHDNFGVEIVNASFGCDSVTEIVRHHHDRYEKDGKEQIPLGARIITIADAYDAMTNDRPYRKAMPQSEALAELHRCEGKQFDPELVEIFEEVITQYGRTEQIEPIKISQEVALNIGRQIESLVAALDSSELSSVAGIAKRLADIASHSQVSEISDVAQELASAAGNEPDLIYIVSLTHQLIDLGRKMHVSLLDHITHTRDFVVVE